MKIRLPALITYLFLAIMFSPNLVGTEALEGFVQDVPFFELEKVSSTGPISKTIVSKAIKGPRQLPVVVQSVVIVVYFVPRTLSPIQIHGYVSSGAGLISDLNSRV